MKMTYILVILVQIAALKVLSKSLGYAEESNDVEENINWNNDKRYHPNYQWADNQFHLGVPHGVKCPPLKINSENGRIICTTDITTHIFCLPECIISKRLSLMPTAFICRNNDPGHWKSPINETLPTDLSCD